MVRKAHSLGRRILSLVLALSVVLSTVVVSAAAEEGEEYLQGVTLSNISFEQDTLTLTDDIDRVDFHMTATVQVAEGADFDGSQPFRLEFRTEHEKGGQNHSREGFAVRGESGEWTLSLTFDCDYNVDAGTYDLISARYGDRSVAFENAGAFTLCKDLSDMADPVLENIYYVKNGQVLEPGFTMRTYWWDDIEIHLAVTDDSDLEKFPNQGFLFLYHENLDYAIELRTTYNEDPLNKELVATFSPGELAMPAGEWYIRHLTVDDVYGNYSHYNAPDDELLVNSRFTLTGWSGSEGQSGDYPGFANSRAMVAVPQTIEMTIPFTLAEEEHLTRAWFYFTTETDGVTVHEGWLSASYIPETADEDGCVTVGVDIPGEFVRENSFLQLRGYAVISSQGSYISAYEPDSTLFSRQFALGYHPNLSLTNLAVDTDEIVLSEDVSSGSFTFTADIVVSGDFELTETTPFEITFTGADQKLGFGRMPLYPVYDTQRETWTFEVTSTLGYSHTEDVYALEYVKLYGEYLYFDALENPTLSFVKDLADKQAPVPTDIRFTVDGETVPNGSTLQKGQGTQMEIHITAEEASALNDSYLYIAGDYSYNHLLLSAESVTLEDGTKELVAVVNVDELANEEWYISNIYMADQYSNSNSYNHSQCDIIAPALFRVSDSEGSVNIREHTYYLNIHWAELDENGVLQNRHEFLTVVNDTLGRNPSLYDLTEDLPQPSLPGLTFRGWYYMDTGKTLTAEDGIIYGGSRNLNLYPVFDQAYYFVNLGYINENGEGYCYDGHTLYTLPHGSTLRDFLMLAASGKTHYAGLTVTGFAEYGESHLDRVHTPDYISNSYDTVYDRTPVHVSYEYEGDSGTVWNSMVLLVENGSTHQQVLDYFAEHYGDVPHAENSGFVGWMCDRENMDETADIGAGYYFYPLYDRITVTVEAMYWNTWGWETPRLTLYLPTDSTLADLLDAAQSMLTDRFTHMEELGYDGTWIFADDVDLNAAAGDGGEYRLVPDYANVPVNVVYTHTYDDLTQGTHGAMEFFPAGTTQQTVVDFFLENRAPNIIHPASLTFTGQWEYGWENADMSEPIRTGMDYLFVPVYEETVVKVEYTYCAEDGALDYLVNDFHTLILPNGATLNSAVQAFDSYAQAYLELGDCLDQTSWDYFPDYDPDEPLPDFTTLEIWPAPGQPIVGISYQYVDQNRAYHHRVVPYPLQEGDTVADLFSAFLQDAEQLSSLHDPDLNFQGWKLAHEGSEGDLLEEDTVYAVHAQYENMVVYVTHNTYTVNEETHTYQTYDVSVPIYLPHGATYAQLRQAFDALNLALPSQLGETVWTWDRVYEDSYVLYHGESFYVTASPELVPVIFLYSYFDELGARHEEEKLVYVDADWTCAQAKQYFQEEIASTLTHAPSLGFTGWEYEESWIRDSDPVDFFYWFSYSAGYANPPQATRLMLRYYTPYLFWHTLDLTDIGVLDDLASGTTYAQVIETAIEQYGLGHCPDLSLTGWSAPEGVSLNDVYNPYAGDVTFTAQYDLWPVQTDYFFLDADSNEIYDQRIVFLPNDATYQDLLDAMDLPGAEIHNPQAVFTGWAIMADGEVSLTDPVFGQESVTVYAQYENEPYLYEITYLNSDGSTERVGFLTYLPAGTPIMDYLYAMELPDCGYEFVGWDGACGSGSFYGGGAEVAARYQGLTPLQIFVEFIADNTPANTTFALANTTFVLYVDGDITDTPYLVSEATEFLYTQDWLIPDGLTLDLFGLLHHDFGHTDHGSGPCDILYTHFIVNYDKSLLIMHLPQGITQSVLVPANSLYTLPSSFCGFDLEWYTESDEVTVTSPALEVWCDYREKTPDYDCGANTTWDFNEHILLLNGAGTVTRAPWSAFGEYIQLVGVSENITSLPSNAFAGCANLTEIWFTGNAPTIKNNSFSGVTATVYYPYGNDTWTEDVMQNYGGEITWEPYSDEDDGGEEPLTGWQQIDGIWYYFNTDGEAVTGWQQIDGVWYYFNEDAVMLTGWQKVDGTWYYFSPSGAMLTGWLSVGGTWYYFNPSGAMVTGWQSVGGVWYYFDPSGAMVTGWLSVGGTWYYFNPSGAMVTGWLSVGGVWYYFNPSGAMVTGWLSVGGAWYYFNPSGAMVTGWLSVGGTWYYFNPSGAMVTGWLSVGGTWYYFNPSGAMVTGWLSVGGVWYYFNPSGAMVTGTQVIGGTTYVFSPSGAWIP